MLFLHFSRDVLKFIGDALQSKMSRGSLPYKNKPHCGCCGVTLLWRRYQNGLDRLQILPHFSHREHGSYQGHSVRLSASLDSPRHFKLSHNIPLITRQFNPITARA
jgi:hypothetical protein